MHHVTDPVLSALTKRRAELAAEAQAADAALRRILADIHHMTQRSACAIRPTGRARSI